MDCFGGMWWCQAGSAINWQIFSWPCFIVMMIIVILSYHCSSTIYNTSFRLILEHGGMFQYWYQKYRPNSSYIHTCICVYMTIWGSTRGIAIWIFCQHCNDQHKAYQVCERGYLSTVPQFSMVNNCFPLLPYISLKPFIGTRDVPVTNCSKRARDSLLIKYMAWNGIKT